MELDSGIIFVKRIPGMSGTSPDPPGIPGIPCARVWDPEDAPGTPGHASGTPGDAPGTPGHAPGTPGDVPETPQGRPCLQGPLMDHKNNHISTNAQRQKRSIAAFEPARWGPSHEALDWADFSIKSPPKSKKLPPAPEMSVRWVQFTRKPHFPVIY